MLGELRVHGGDEFPVHILDFLRAHLGQWEGVSISAAKSAQQQVWILTLGPPHTVADDSCWRHALEQGRRRLVVRLWKSGRRWWNLNHDDRCDLYSAAISEVTAYRLAREALTAVSGSKGLRIPRVLHFSVPVENENPWAILEYVGEHSTLFEEASDLDSSWIDSMVQVRTEFGFSEPHPRWGRVPVDKALTFARHVLFTVMVPLHTYQQQQQIAEAASRFIGLDFPKHTENSTTRGYRFMDMVNIYHEKLSIILKQVCLQDKRSQVHIQLLEKAIVFLEQEGLANGFDDETLPCVLCHMDCQPQNLLFCRGKNDDSPRIVSVLDWEEAAYADPRFELLLLCRKVAANRTQAEHLWQSYQDNMACQLGPIDPWLLLETVHSITTLLLQACVGSAGKSPWEAAPDLWGKIDRECKRLGPAA
jgi:hypothetical protein